MCGSKSTAQSIDIGRAAITNKAYQLELRKNNLFESLYPCTALLPRQTVRYPIAAYAISINFLHRLKPV